MKVEEIAEAIAKLPPDQLARFRRRSIPIMRASDELLSGTEIQELGTSSCATSAIRPKSDRSIIYAAKICISTSTKAFGAVTLGLWLASSSYAFPYRLRLARVSQTDRMASCQRTGCNGCTRVASSTLPAIEAAARST